MERGCDRKNSAATNVRCSLRKDLSQPRELGVPDDKDRRWCHGRGSSSGPVMHFLSVRFSRLMSKPHTQPSLQQSQAREVPGIEGSVDTRPLPPTPVQLQQQLGDS